MNRDGAIDLTDARQLVDTVEVRLVSRTRRALWDRLMSRHHYLGFHSMVGESLRDVAVYKEHWVALLGWAAPAPSCKVRDRWIGWPSDLKRLSQDWQVAYHHPIFQNRYKSIVRNDCAGYWLCRA